MVDEWVGHLFHSQVIGVSYIDFCKAFDLADHNLLLKMMRVYRFHKDSLAWFAAYLSERKQCATINKTTSDQQLITHGVPQGSVFTIRTPTFPPVTKWYSRTGLTRIKTSTFLLICNWICLWHWWQSVECELQIISLLSKDDKKGATNHQDYFSAITLSVLSITV